MNETTILLPIMEKLDAIQQDIISLKTNINDRFITLESDMDNRFSALESDMDNRFSALESELQKLDHTVTKTRRQCLTEFIRFRYDINQSFRDIGIISDRLSTHMNDKLHHLS